jgi:hypothetical protein
MLVTKTATLIIFSGGIDYPSSHYLIDFRTV